MKNFFITLTLFQQVIFAFSQTDSIKGNQYLLKGKIINKISTSPPCGYFAFASVVEFEIISFSDSTYKEKNIGVVFTCLSDGAASFLSVGRIYEITVADENQADFSWIITNEEVLKKHKMEKKLWKINTKK